MSLDKVPKDIKHNGDEDAERIRQEGRAEAERILSEAKAKRTALMAESMSEAKKAIERLRIQEISRVELENRRAQLMMQKDMLDLALEKARTRIAALPPDKDRDILRRLIGTRGVSANVVISCRRQEATVKALAPTLRYGGSIECMGGVILQTVDGSVRYDLRYDTILEQAAQLSMKDVAKLLFQG